MYQIKYRIKTKSPILISSNSGDANMVSTMDYIPGTVLSGIFAWKYIENKKNKKLYFNAHEDDFFYRCFLNSGLCFSNAYITKEHMHGSKDYFPAPLSIQHEKNNEKKIFDLLVNETDKQTKIIGSYCNINVTQIEKALPEKSLNFHHNRNRERQIENRRERLIFNYESLNSGQEFSGRITGSKTDLENFLKHFNKSLKINVGRSKNIQYGQAVIDFSVLNPTEFNSEIETFNPEIDDEFILTLLSPAIIYNENGYSITSVSEFKKYIADYIGTSKDNFEIDKNFIKTVTVENFVSVWLLKRPNEAAFAAGSCFKVRIKNWDEKIKNQLLELQQKGIGERTNEGFGRFVLNWQNLDIEEYKTSESKKNKPKKPDGSPPEVAKNVIENVVVLQYKKDTESMALSDCHEFCKDKARLPSNSFLGRLEMIIKREDPDLFGTIIDTNLREPAKDKLKKCRTNNKNLFEFITEMNPDIDQKILKQIPELDSCLEVISYNPYSDKKLKKDLYRLYWITFLRNMRKTNRGEIK